MATEAMALQRSEPGTNVTPIYNPTQLDAETGSRKNTPPIVTSLDETLEEVLSSQVGKQ